MHRANVLMLFWCCRAALLQNHVLIHPLCAPAIIDEHSMRTFGGNRLRLECDAQGVLIEGSRIRNDFNLANNGVMQVLDDVILPNRGDRHTIIIIGSDYC